MPHYDKPLKPSEPPVESPPPSSKVSPETLARLEKVWAEERKNFVVRLNANALQSEQKPK